MTRKKWFLFCVLLMSSVSVYSKEISVVITNNLDQKIYVGASELSEPDDDIVTTPSEVSEHAKNKKLSFKNIKDSYFEIYVGLKPGHDMCTFTYEIGKGIQPQECPNFDFSILGNSLVING